MRYLSSGKDNCGDNLSVSITKFGCLATSKKGNLIDKTKSCVIKVGGDTISILDTGGVANNITWTIKAADQCGNTAMTECKVAIVKP